MHVQCARVDSKVPVEDVIKTLSGFVKEGKFDYIGMSECSEKSLRRGHAVSYSSILAPLVYERC